MELPKQDIHLLSQSLPKTRNHSYRILLIEHFDIFLEIGHLPRAVYSLSINTIFEILKCVIFLTSGCISRPLALTVASSFSFDKWFFFKFPAPLTPFPSPSPAFTPQPHTLNNVFFCPRTQCWRSRLIH